MISSIVLISMIVLGAGYWLYGGFLAKHLRLDNSKPTPAHTMGDGVDYVPANSFMLLGQHFSAIAAAGPIVGPILAGIWFGWVPALLWILLGSIFIGGVHDFFSIVASIRNRGESIGELVRQTMSRHTQILFLVFVWLALIYVIIAFTDITAQSFRAVSGSEAFGPAVVFGSFLYLLLGVGMGVVLKTTRIRLTAATLIFLPLVFLVIWLGSRLPASVSAYLLRMPVKGWEAGILGYCFIASIIPVWLLLQPRGYLGGWFLYLTLAVALGGALFGGYAIQYPAFHLEGLKSLANGKLVFPILFITVACGACSGFHGVVATGTTAKQISKESDARVVGYGAMILEALVAVMALATVMMLSKNDSMLKGDPNLVYAGGLARYMQRVGITPGFAISFALLAFATFVYDTLDVATRLARYVLQELMNWRTKTGAALATFITLLIPFFFLMLAREKAYLLAWPIFGTSNQLLASLTLLTISVWLVRTNRNPLLTLIPMVFMTFFTLWSLGLQILPFLKHFPHVLSGTTLQPDLWISGICGIVLLVLAVLLMAESVRALFVKKK